MRLIDADELQKKIVEKIDYKIKWTLEPNAYVFRANEIYDMIETAPTVVKRGITSEGLPRPRGDCEKCDFRKFTETFIDSVVDMMNKNGITSVEQLQEILKGGADMRTKP